MDETTLSLEQLPLRAQGKRLLDLWRTAAEQFRSGEDSEGIGSLITAAAELEILMETDRNSRRPHIDLSRLLPSLKMLYFYTHNQDLTGIADLLEDALCPLTGLWLRGCGDA